MITYQEVRQIRLLLKITQFELGYFLGYSRSFITKFESGERSLTADKLIEVHEVLKKLTRANRRSLNDAQRVLNFVQDRNCPDEVTKQQKIRLSSGVNLLL